MDSKRLYSHDGEPIFWIPPGESPQLVVPSAAFLPLVDDRDWGHGPLGLAELHAKGINGHGVKVCVVDTGVSQQHPDLKAGLAGVMSFTGEPAEDGNGHGSHCLGIVGARANDTGLIGAAPGCQLLSAKSLTNQGWGTSSMIANGIDWARLQGADVISLSLGSPEPDEGIHDAIKRADEAGVIVVAAAGNSGPGENTADYPGAFDECLGVAAIDKNLAVASFSSRGRTNDVAAPGVQINSTYKSGRYAVLSGTSMATPYVAGCIALVLAYCKAKGLAKPNRMALLELIRETSKDLDAGGFDTRTGWGLIQPWKIIQKLGGSPPPPPPPPMETVIIRVPELKARGLAEVAFTFAKP